MTREEAKAELTCILNHEGEYMDYLSESEVEAIKTLAVERPHGEWKGHVERKNLNTRKCTSCGEYGAVGYFCMWCGADMMKEGDEK